MNDNLVLFIIILLIAGLLIGPLSVIIVTQIKVFKRELRFLNTEIAKADGAEKKYWKARKHQLWLSLLPFVKY